MAEDVDFDTQTCLTKMREELEKALPKSVEFSFSEQEKGRRFLPVCCNPREYLEILRDSREYKKTVEGRQEAAEKKCKEISRISGIEEIPPTNEEIVQVYEEEEAFKQLFWNFYEDVLHLSYKPNKYSKEFNQLFEKYRIAAKISIGASLSGKDRDEIIEKDRLRSEAHNSVARKLVEEDYVRTEYLARMLVRAFLVDLNEDFIASARLSDQTRRLRALEDRTARAEYFRQVQEAEKASKFSPGSRDSIQRNFLKKHPASPLVDRTSYQGK